MERLTVASESRYFDVDFGSIEDRRSGGNRQWFEWTNIVATKAVQSPRLHAGYRYNRLTREVARRVLRSATSVRAFVSNHPEVFERT